MKRINEIFYSLQGEGMNTGRAAVFVRFSGCNLRCPFCDTQHQQGQPYEDDSIVQEALGLVRGITAEKHLAIFTGGEPSLQLDSELVEKFHAAGFEVAVETNGTRPLPNNMDFITISPKDDFLPEQERKPLEGLINRIPSELKVVYNGENNIKNWERFPALAYYLQPCDTGDAEKNAEIIRKSIEFIKANPKWRLSLQTQKILDIR